MPLLSLHRRTIQRQLLRHLRRASQPLALTESLFTEIAREGGLDLRWPKDREAVRVAVVEMIEQRILLCTEEWDFGKVCSLAAQPILGETPEERFARLPQLPELPASMILIGNLLIFVDAVLFFIFYCYYLPQAWIGPVTGTGALIGAILSYAGLRLSDQRALTTLHWTMKKWLAVALVGGLLAWLTILGANNPCEVGAPPGADIYVDGKWAAKSPGIDSEEPLKWQQNQIVKLHLRWDEHEVSVRKRWHVTGNWREQSNQTVHLSWSNWRHPGKFFEDWKMEAELLPLLRIAPGWVVPQDQRPESQAVDERWKNLVSSWNVYLRSALQESVDECSDVALKPFVLRVELRVKEDNSGTISFALFNLKEEMVRPFLPITIRDVTEIVKIEDARQTVFERLEDEFQIRKLRLPKKEADKLQAKATIQQAALDLSQDVPIAQTTSATTSALPQIEQTVGTGLATDATRQALWYSSAVAKEAMRLGKPKEAIAVAEELAQVGEAAAQAGDIATATTVRQSLDNINLEPAPAPSEETNLQLNTTKDRVVNALAAADSKPIKPRVYLQIAGEPQRGFAQEIQSALQRADYAVPGIQNVLGRAYVPKLTEIRYFDPSAAEEAKKIGRILDRMSKIPSQTSYVKPSKSDLANSTDIKTHFEIWFAR